MKLKTIRADWLERNGRRLDCNPYMTGAIEARAALQALKARKESLHSLTRGHNEGIYNGPQFKRNFVESREHGVPFLTSGNMLDADLSTLPLLRKRDAESTKLAYLRLASGTTLISCSGTIGRMAFVRPDMNGVWSSQDVLKVVPDESKIPPGYLYAFLSSKFGVPLVVGGTYGAIIQHIEPEHIAGLPVPRFDGRLEAEISELVERAAHNRSQAVSLMKEGQDQLEKVLGLSRASAHSGVEGNWISIPSHFLQERCDAFYFDKTNLGARSALDSTSMPSESLGGIARVFIPDIFKRLYSDDPVFGYPYITGGDVFEISPTSDKFLIRRVAEDRELLLRQGMIVIQEAGQLGGLIGRSVLVGHYLDGFACSNNMVRVIPHSAEDTGYVYAVLSSKEGVRLIAREAAGSSIPHLDAGRVAKVSIPWPPATARKKIGKPVRSAVDLRDKACDLEKRARELIEIAIEGKD